MGLEILFYLCGMFIERELYRELLSYIPDKRFAIITGARQVGKTTILRELYAELSRGGHKVDFLSLEDPLIRAAANEHPEQIFRSLREKPRRILDGLAPEKQFLLLDEVQYADDPSHLLKYLYDTYEGNLKIIATGSSAFYIDRQFRDSLAGRKRIFRLSGLDFREYLQFSGKEELAIELDALRQRSDYQSRYVEDLRLLFWEYLRFGGYPAVALESDEREKQFVLDELKNAYVRRDVLDSKVSDETRFYRLFQLLADQTGNLVNKNSLGADLQMDAKTVDHYLYVLQKCFHISLIKPFSRNLRKELTKMPKVYFNDLGMRNALLNRFETIPGRADKGQLLENYYFLRLRQQYSEEQLLFWRTTDQQEVDFVVRERPEAGMAFEVKWAESRTAENKYAGFSKSYPHFPLQILTAEDFWSF